MDCLLVTSTSRLPYPQHWVGICTSMPTITLQVGQCGNQLGATLWEQLREQQSRCSSSLLSSEWFARLPQQQQQFPTESEEGQHAHQAAMQPRCICIDSEAKVVKQWQGQQRGQAQPVVHMLGRGGGCGNNWSCGYSLAFSASTGNSVPCAWSMSEDQLRCIDQVLDGVRREAEREAGVPDFLLLSSLAGGTGSGFGSALLETVADEYPCSTLAAVAVAPGRAGGSDTAMQSINSCLALQHLSTYAHVVLLLDNQVLLDQLNARGSNRPAGRQQAGAASASRGSTAGSSSSSRRGVLGVSASAPASGRACLQGVNELAAQALLGLLWPVGEADQMARRTNIRQLATTIAADPLTKLLEVCHVAQPDADIPVNLLDTQPWPARIKLLASQLPSYDPFTPTQPVTTSAALLVARGGMCTPPTRTAAANRGRTANTRFGSAAGGGQHNGSCWASLGGLGCVDTAAACAAGAGGSCNAGWDLAAALGAIGSSWPRWRGFNWDVFLGDSSLPLWNAASGASSASLTAAVRRSSTGSFLRDVSAKCLQLCDAGAYMHWYQQYGTEQAEIRASAARLVGLAEAY